jgi:hypothetical protein
MDVKLIESRQTVRILLNPNPQSVKYIRRDPAGAQFCSREGLFVKNQAFSAMLPQFPRTSRTRRPSANDDDFRIPYIHFQSYPFNSCSYSQLTFQP